MASAQFATFRFGSVFVEQTLINWLSKALCLGELSVITQGVVLAVLPQTTFIFGIMNFPELYKNKPFFEDIEIMHLYYIEKDFLKHLINPSIKYTWIHKFPILGINWQEIDWPIFGQERIPFMSRQTEMDIIVETDTLETVYPILEKHSTHVIQMNIIPPYYLRLESVQGNERYRLLKEIDYYFELDTGGGQEWGTLTSSNVQFWEKLNSNPLIDWAKMARPKRY